MPTVREILGDDFIIYKSQGIPDSEIKKIATQKYRTTPPPQPLQNDAQLPPVEQVPKTIFGNDTPAWYMGQEKGGLVNLSGDYTDGFYRGLDRTVTSLSNSTGNVLRGLGKTGVSFANMLPFGDEYHEKATKLLQKLENITEQNKDSVRTPERKVEVEALKKQSADAATFGDKLKAGLNSVVDTVKNPNEWQFGEFVGENLNPVNLIPAGKGVLSGALIGGGLNAAQAAAFDAPRTDKSSLDMAVDVALGGATGVVLGGITGGLTKKSPQPKVDEAGMLIDPFEKGDHTIRATPQEPLNKTTVQTPQPKVDEVGMLIDPFEKGDHTIRVTPKQFHSELVDKKSFQAFSDVLANETARVAEADISIKTLGAEMQQRGASPKQIEQAIAESHPPSPEAITISRILNDGQDLDPRINGVNAQQAIINSIENSTKTPQEFYDAMLGYGATAQHANIATRAYEARDITPYTTWALEKLAKSKEQFIDMNTIVNDAHALVAERMGTTQDIQNISNSSINDMQSHLSQLQSHERYQEVLDMTRALDSQNKRSPQMLESGKKVSTIDTPSEYKTTVEMPTYAQNYGYDFALTKDKVQRIESGNPTPKDLADLQSDLQMVERNPTFAKDPAHVINDRLEAEQAFGDIKPIDTLTDEILARNPEVTTQILDFVHTNAEVADRKVSMSLGDVTSGFVKVMRDTVGLDLEGFTRKLDNYSIRHIFKQHGKASEFLRGQIPITDKDIALIPQIVESAYEISLSKNNIGRDVIHYKSRIGDKFYYFEEVRNGKKELVPQTLYKMKDEPLPDAKAPSETLTPETLPSKESIAQTDSNVDNILNSNQKDIQNISKEPIEIYLGEDTQGNKFMKNYKEWEADLELESRMIKQMEDCIL